MKFCSTILAAALLNAPALAVPTEEGRFSLEERVPILLCKPKLNGIEKPFKVDEAVARQQVTKAGLKEGISGYPHSFGNKERLTFGVTNCDKKTAVLVEYPIYWVGKNAEWQKDVKVDKQPGGPTPIRVVFANNAGSAQYCGVMTHKVVNAQNSGSGDFILCK